MKMEFNFNYNQALEFLTQAYYSPFFTVIKFLLVVYITVLLVDIILLLILRGVGADLRIAVKGMDMPAVSKNKALKKWQGIKKRLESENISQYKAAILEADRIVDDILSKIGYKGKNIAERLEQVKPGQLENVEDLKGVHKVRNRIIYEKDFMIDKKTAKDVIETYENLLKELDYI
ncbi:hypothetical protein J7J13_02555 [bacterium]|nr:hypothetical protein [bacterium]